MSLTYFGAVGRGLCSFGNLSQPIVHTRHVVHLRALLRFFMSASSNQGAGFLVTSPCHAATFTELDKLARRVRCSSSVLHEEMSTSELDVVVTHCWSTCWSAHASADLHFEAGIDLQVWNGSRSEMALKGWCVSATCYRGVLNSAHKL